VHDGKQNIYIPGKRVPNIARCKIGMKKKVRLRSWFWKNHGVGICW